MEIISILRYFFDFAVFSVFSCALCVQSHLFEASFRESVDIL